jgi:hypothetical protein
MLPWSEKDDSPTPELLETITPDDYTVCTTLDRLLASTHITLVLTMAILTLARLPLDSSLKASVA